MQSKLMARLGYQRYGAQGGDWGAIINTPARTDRFRPHGRTAPQHVHRRTAPIRMRSPRNGSSRRQKQRVVFGAEETGYQADTGDQAANARLRLERLADRPCRLDRGEVPHVVRLRRESRERSSRKTSCSRTSPCTGSRKRRRRRRGSTTSRGIRPVRSTTRRSKCRLPAPTSRRRSSRHRAAHWSRATTWCG